MSEDNKSTPSTVIAEFDSGKVNLMLSSVPAGNKLTLIKVGTDERPASSEDIQMVQQAFSAADANPNISIVTHHAIEVESYIKDNMGQLVKLSPSSFQKYLFVIRALEPDTSMEERLRLKLADIGITAAVIVVPNAAEVHLHPLGA